MDTRVRRHAEVLVDQCADVRRGDMVTIRASRQAEALVVALYEALGQRGARPSLSWSLPRATRAYARAMDEADYTTKDHELAAMEETDVVFLIGGGPNAFETSDVPRRCRRRAAAPTNRSPSSDWTRGGSSPRTPLPRGPSGPG